MSHTSGHMETLQTDRQHQNTPTGNKIDVTYIWTHGNTSDRQTTPEHSYREQNRCHIHLDTWKHALQTDRQHQNTPTGNKIDVTYIWTHGNNSDRPTDRQTTPEHSYREQNRCFIHLDTWKHFRQRDRQTDRQHQNTPTGNKIDLDT